jgi:hypothetical protein
VEKRKFLTLPGLELVQLIASRYTDCAIPALNLAKWWKMAGTAEGTFLCNRKTTSLGERMKKEKV